MSDKKDSVNCLTQKSVGLKKKLNEYTCSDILQLHEEITEKYSNLLGPLPLKLPPHCEVSHKIPLIDESTQLKHWLPKCPEVFCSELAHKIEWYTTIGWWVPAATKQATPVHLVPTTMTITGRGITWLILKEVMRLHGIPESIVSDWDTKFTSIFWKELHRLMRSKLLMSIVFHPQTDGATERAYRSIAQILCTIVSNDQKDWLGKCLMVEFAINSSVNITMGYAPFKLSHGYMPWSG